MLLVVHIPKTAGTSLRIAISRQFAADRVVLDYGESAAETSACIREQLYGTAKSLDAVRVVEDLRSGGKEVLMGHFKLSKYGAGFANAEIISFVREPLARACSEYLHRTRNGTFKGSIEEFFETPDFQNVQARFLAGRSPGIFVGVTEYYRDSLNLLNERFGLDLAHKRRNRGSGGGGSRISQQLDDRVKKRFYDLNQTDAELYRSIRRELDERLRSA